MATIAQIISFAKRKKYSDETDANLLIDLQGIQDEIYLQLRSHHEACGTRTIKEHTTVAAQLEYAIDSNCEWENIVLVRCSIDTSEDSWYIFEYAGEKEDIASGYFWKRETEDKIAVYIDGEAIQTAGLTLQIFYNKTPAAISATSQTPDLRSEYHNLFKYALIQLLCEQGDNPDLELANVYKTKYYEFLDMIKSDLESKRTSLPYSSMQKKEEW